MTIKSPTFCVAIIVLTALRCFGNLGDSPEAVAARIKRGLTGVKQGLDRHFVEATFEADGFSLFTFLDGRVCRETHVKRGDAPQYDAIRQLLEAPESAGHQWNQQPTTSGNKRWRRDDGKIDILYGAIEKTSVKQALTVTAPNYEEHLEKIVANEGRDIPGDAPSADEIKSRIESTLRSVASARQTVSDSEQTAAYQLGYALTRYGIPLTVVGVVIRSWTRRVARKTPKRPGESRGKHYRLLLLKMTWRTAVIFVASMFVVMLSQMSPAISTQQAGEAGAIAFLLLLLFCLPTMFLTSWTQTKQKFAVTSVPSVPAMSNATPPASTSAEPETSRVGTTISDKAMTSRRSINTTWWKRLFTVLEIAIFLISLILAIALYATSPSYDSRWPLLILVAVPVVVVRSVRVALIYIVEGKSPFRR